MKLRPVPHLAANVGALAIKNCGTIVRKYISYTEFQLITSADA